MPGKAIKVDAEQLSDDALRLENDLRGKVVGQDRAVKQFVRAYEAFNAGLNPPHRPVANLLFIGPTGSGKTRMVEALAEALFHNQDAMIKIDCAEFQHSHEVAKLIGSPPGYVGHRESEARLTKKKLEEHWRLDTPRVSIVLFDEIEKAHPDFAQLLLGILDKGILNLGNGDTVDFSSTIIVMTSNLGSKDIAELLSGGQLGFHTTADQTHEDLDQQIYKSSIHEIRRHFSPEFIGRIDRTIVFRPLSKESLRRILDIELKAVQDRIILSGKVIALDFTDRAKTFLLAEGTNDREGARQLKKVIQRSLVAKLSSLIATKQARNGDQILVDKENNEPGLSFYVRPDVMKIPLRTYDGTPAELSSDIENSHTTGPA